MTQSSTDQHRWVVDEPDIPFNLDVLYEDDKIIVVDKPHFLATIPRGMWYRQTALIRLRENYGESDIIPAHRLDRMTAGVVVFVRDPVWRRAYQMLFQERRVEKTYECLAPCAPVKRPETGIIRRIESPKPFPLERRSHIVKERGRLQAYEIPGETNSRTIIERCEAVTYSLPNVHTQEPQKLVPSASLIQRHKANNQTCCPPRLVQVTTENKTSSGSTCYQRHSLVSRYVLHPITGKTHQLRIHMASLGLTIIGDDMYPQIAMRDYDDFSTPLELVARRVEFDDPATGEHRCFESRIPLGVACQ